MAKVKYQCPRCGYETIQKNSIRMHLMHKKKTCPALENNIDLTEDIIEHVLANRIYKMPKQDKKTTIINNYNQYNNINNIIAGMDVIEKLEHYMSFKGQSLMDFESSVERKFKKTVTQLDNDSFKNNYFLKEDNLLDMVGKATQPSSNEKDSIQSHNIIYDNKLKELKIYDGTWEAMSLDAGTKHYIERIQKNFLDSYERYLLRNLNRLQQGQERAVFREMLEQYYAFIGCFGMDPYCYHANDDEILRPVSSSDSEGSDDDSSIDSIMRIGLQRGATCKLSEEYYPVYKQVFKGLSKTYINKMIRSVQDMLKRNSAKNVTELNRKITGLFHMDETFRDILLSIQNKL